MGSQTGELGLYHVQMAPLVPDESLLHYSLLNKLPSTNKKTVFYPG